MKKRILESLITGLIIVASIIACDTMNNKVTIGNPKKKPQEPVRKEYMALLPDSLMHINNWAIAVDSILIDHQYRIDSLIYELSKKK